MKLYPHSSFFSRFSERKRWSGSGPLPGRYLSLRHHLLGVSDPRSPRAPWRGLRVRQASTASDFPEPSFHGPAAAVRDRRSVSLHGSGLGERRHHVSVPLLRKHRPFLTFILLQTVHEPWLSSYCDVWSALILTHQSQKRDSLESTLSQSDVCLCMLKCTTCTRGTALFGFVYLLYRSRDTHLRTSGHRSIQRDPPI